MAPQAIVPPNCYLVDVEGIGQFIFRKRLIRHQVQIEAMGGGLIEEPGLRLIMRSLNQISVLAFATPPGWNPDDEDFYDPFDEESGPKRSAEILLVASRMNEEEKKIRRPNRVVGAELGAGAQSDGGVPVAAPV